jgi:alpha,alpha-trehalose phosphorylase
MSHNILKPVIDIKSDDCLGFRTLRSGLSGSFRWFISEPDRTVDILEEKIIIKCRLTQPAFVKVLSYAFGTRGHEGLALSFSELANLQRRYLSNFWDVAKIHIEEAPGSGLRLEEAVNYGIYALLSSLGTDRNGSISAKGLSGSGYEGHIFWDAETYIFPVFMHLQPDLARSMMAFRINTLSKARSNAVLLGYTKGVLYPWRTISGAECSAFFEAGAAQHHINADIAYAFIQYYKSTKETDIFFNGGFEVLLEISRLFSDIGYQRDGKFHIDMVTGPDEYTVLVGDNYYTNVMVKNVFLGVNMIADVLSVADPVRWRKLEEHLAVCQNELDNMKLLAEIIEKPFCHERKIVKQDRDFLNKPLWPRPFEGEKKPLLLHYHPLIIYRYQVSKQADAVMALCLLPDEEDDTVIQNSVEYYDKVTIHDSSLSYSTFSTVYSRIGNTGKAFKYFLENARCDLDNLHGNTKDGLHNASIGGTITNVLYGFCGLRFDETGFSTLPNLPKEIKSIKFSIYYDGEIHKIVCPTEK